MLITPANLSFFFTTLETSFWNAYRTADVTYDKICTTYSVSTEQWVSGWIGMTDKVREWRGSRVTKQPAPQTYIVTPKLFEQTESIDKYKLLDDTYGIYAPLPAFMGMQNKKWPDYQVRDLLLNQGSWTGASQNGTDGLTHWNTAHPVDLYDAAKGTYSNDFLGGFVVDGITVGGALGLNSFSTLWSEIASRKSESGEALGITADLTMVAPQLKLTLDTILNAQFTGQPTIGNLTGNIGATENMLKGWTSSLMWPDLADAPTTWYELVTKMPMKPFSWLLRQPPTFVIRNQEQDPVVFDTHTYLYGSDMRGAPAWGFPWLSARSGPTP